MASFWDIIFEICVAFAVILELVACAELSWKSCLEFRMIPWRKGEILHTVARIEIPVKLCLQWNPAIITDGLHTHAIYKLAAVSHILVPVDFICLSVQLGPAVDALPVALYEFIVKVELKGHPVASGVFWVVETQIDLVEQVADILGAHGEEIHVLDVDVAWQFVVGGYVKPSATVSVNWILHRAGVMATWIVVSMGCMPVSRHVMWSAQRLNP